MKSEDGSTTPAGRQGFKGLLPRRRFLGGAGSAAVCLVAQRLGARSTAETTGLDFQKLLRPVPPTAKFEMDGYYVWGGSMTRDAAGKCHLFFARWAKSTTFRGWVTHSQVGHAVADQPLGPYAFEDLALEGDGGSGWDAHMIHNPTVLQHDGKYYLYYTGTRGTDDWKPGVAIGGQDDYWVFRNNQRIGVAVADNPGGPWKRRDAPLLDVSASGWDTLITTNPSVCRAPDGRFLMVYKAASPGEKPAGKVVHGVAFADSPEGPFVKHPDPVFTHESAEFPAEDPSIWRAQDRYYAIVKDMGGFFTEAGRSLVLFESRDGIDWNLSEHALVSELQIDWKGGELQEVHRLERPQIYLEEGRPAVLFCAVNPARDHAHTFNVHIPLGTGEE